MVTCIEDIAHTMNDIEQYSPGRLTAKFPIS